MTKLFAIFLIASLSFKTALAHAPHGSELTEENASSTSVEQAEASQDALQLDPRLLDRLADEFTPEAEKLNLVVFHGLLPQAKDWLPEDLTWPADAQAFDALNRGELNHPSFAAENIHPLRQAQRLALLGKFKAAQDVLAAEDAYRSQLLHAECTYALGDHAGALAQLRTLLQLGKAQADLSAEALHALGRASLLLATWSDTPSGWQAALDFLGRARTEVNPLYWPAYLEEALFLLASGQPETGMGLLTQAIRLNPSSAEGWYWLAKANLGAQKIDVATELLGRLTAIQENSPWTQRLAIDIALAQREFTEADRLIDDARALTPSQPDLLTLQAVSAAMQADDPRLRRALDAAEQVRPQHHGALLAAGEGITALGQFEPAYALLSRAAERAPHHSRLQTGLGYVSLMLDRPQEAAQRFRTAVRLNPYDTRAKNRLTMAEAIQAFATIETDHFIIRYRPGIDEAFARDLAHGMETIVHPLVTERFGHTPAEKTGIEIMPDQDWFAVRLTGLPDFWTFAAAVGNVIVVAPPRHGKNLKGTYDWLSVLIHEYTHTVTLDLTNRRVPRWFTEGAAVNMELQGRRFDAHQQLAEALAQNALLPLDGINRPFINPQRAEERGLAYAQSSWLFEHIESVYGAEAIARLHQAFAQQKTVSEAFVAELGVEPNAFMESFKVWGQEQVKAWGLEKEQFEANAALRSIAEQALDQALAGANTPIAEQAIQAYAEASPQDPWVHHARLKLGRTIGDPRMEAQSLAALDTIEARHGQYAYALAKRHQIDGDLEAARDAAQRAVEREPYNGDYRELAAVIDLQRADQEAALRQLEMLTLIEPEASIHWVRYAALLDQMGRPEEAEQARRRSKPAE